LGVAAGLLPLFLLSAYADAIAQSDDLLTLLVNTCIGLVAQILLTPGGIISFLILGSLFYRFRTPPDRGTVDDGYELLRHALRLERKGQVEQALKAYEYIATRYSHTTAGQDAQKSIENLKALR
jgi:hypothetical protein